MRIAYFILLFVVPISCFGQYAPQAGLVGSTAISATSSDISGWATGCSVSRGYIDIATPSMGLTTGGTDANATGAADGSIVCLGDSGLAVLTFSAPIYNGSGADFAVFENGFINPADPSAAFLELAFVEVSSDGVNYHRFPARSNTQTNTQIPGSGVYMDASAIHNLAGKYIANYGVPFDLEDLSGVAGLDVNNVTHVRLVDVIGNITAHTSTDAVGNPINDPYPTNFATGGFDLDAVGVMHQKTTGVGSLEGNNQIAVFPNPVADRLHITAPEGKRLLLNVTTAAGQQMIQTEVAAKQTTIETANYPSGVYFVVISDESGNKWVGRVLKY